MKENFTDGKHTVLRGLNVFLPPWYSWVNLFWNCVASIAYYNVPFWWKWCLSAFVLGSEITVD